MSALGSAAERLGAMSGCGLRTGSVHARRHTAEPEAMAGNMVLFDGAASGPAVLTTTGRGEGSRTWPGAGQPV